MGLICSFLILKRINDNPVMTDAFNARTTLNLTFLISIIFYSRLISRLISSILVQVLVFLSQRGWACISGVSLLQQKWKRFFSSDSLLSGWIAQQWQCSYIILSQAHRGKDLRLSHLDPGASLLSVCLSLESSSGWRWWIMHRCSSQRILKSSSCRLKPILKSFMKSLKRPAFVKAVTASHLEMQHV